MNVFGFGPYVAVIPFVSSLVFFFLAKEKTFSHRILTSVHGWAAISIVPFSILIATHFPGLRMSVGLPIALVLGGVSSVSVFYSVATVKARWAFHLLHIPTVFAIALSVMASLFVLADHH